MTNKVALALFVVLLVLLQAIFGYAKTDKYLLVDDTWIEFSARVHRTIHQPQRLSALPVLVPDKLWEGNAICLFGSVIVREDGLFQMWYQTFVKYVEGTVVKICYAESQNGINWVKPSLGLVEFAGSKQNNILLEYPYGTMDSPSVIFEPESKEPNRRYKMIYFAEPKGKFAEKKQEWGEGLFAAFSQDGIHWSKTDPEYIPVARDVGDRTNIMRAADSEVPYVAFTRRYDMMEKMRGRCIYRSDSKNFIHWSDPQLVFLPDLQDNADWQFYGMIGFPYEGMYLGCLEVLHTQQDYIDCQLVTSRDGVSWQRSQPRVVFLPAGQPEQWDSRWVNISANPPIRQNDRLWFYYSGRNAAHKQMYPFPYAAVGVATLRIDGFASIEAGFSEGYIVTKPVPYGGEKLYLNFDTRTLAGVSTAVPSAWVRIEVQDEQGNPILKSKKDEASKLQGDSIRYLAQLDYNALKGHIGKKIRLKFELVNANLYSFWLEASP